MCIIFQNNMQSWQISVQCSYSSNVFLLHALFACQDILLKGILRIVEANMNMEPLHFLSFPVIIGPSVPGGVSASSRQNGAAAGKGVGLLWKGKLSSGRRESNTDFRQSHFRSSPWHTAPLHLPLVGQNCWPHMANGFSASMWLRVTEQEKDGDKDEGETQNTKILCCLWSISMNLFWDSSLNVFQRREPLLQQGPTMAPLRQGLDWWRKASFIFCPWALRH